MCRFADWLVLALRNHLTHDCDVRKILLLVGATMVLVVLLAWTLLALGAGSVWFALLMVWLPMVWLGTVSRIVTPRLPDGCHTLRGFELDGRLYELFGVKLFKSLLRRGPLAVFNPDLHLPTERTPVKLAHLDQRMRDAEASHSILFILTLGLAAFEAANGLWSTAVWIVVFNLLLNGYPVMLQRYNRALLRQRFELADN
jgi:hypothetical protein